MTGWLDANPTKRKTARGIKRFVNSWLARAQDKGGSNLTPRYQKSTVKQMTTLDDLSHNFLGCPTIREYMLDKHGQCFENGIRYTREEG